MSTTISAADVKALREKTGAGMMDCKNALVESEGDIDKATELLRVKMGNKLGKLAGRETSRRHGSRPTCTPPARSACWSRSSATPTSWPRTRTSSSSPRTSRCTSPPSPQTKYITEDEIPQEDKDREIRVFEELAADKPENIRPKIVEGQLKKWYGRGRPARPGARQRRQARRQDDRAAAWRPSAKTGENVVVSGSSASLLVNDGAGRRGGDMPPRRPAGSPRRGLIPSSSASC